MQVSVVVAVHNPGRGLRALVQSFRGQTLPSAQREIIVVDDGSDESSLRWVRAQHDVRLVRSGHSGSPGRPWNIGLGLARGEYVFLCNQDDLLRPRGLEEVSTFADKNLSDVVIARLASKGGRRASTVGNALFAFDRSEVVVEQDLVFGSLRPQKLYRRSFLQRAHLRFKEGEQRLESHLFVAQAYLRADVISVYARSEVCEVDREIRAVSAPSTDFIKYFRHLSDVLVLVDAEALAPQRTSVARARWLRAETIARLRGESLLRRGVHQRSLVLAAADFLDKHYGAEELNALPLREQVVAELALRRDVDSLVEFARWETSLVVRPELRVASIDKYADQLALQTSFRVTAASPLPVAIQAADRDRLLQFDASDVSIALRDKRRRIKMKSLLRLQEGRVSVHSFLNLAAATQLYAGGYNLEVRLGADNPFRAAISDPALSVGVHTDLDQAVRQVKGRPMQLRPDRQARARLQVGR